MTFFEKRLLFLILLAVVFLLGLVVEKRYEVVNVSGGRDEKVVVSKEKKMYPIDINKATFEDFVALPGIGEVKAKEIIKLREKLGGFKSLKDLLKVPGIGEKTFEKIKKYITIDRVLSKFERRVSSESTETISQKSKVNVNTATLEELISLPGIGEVKAKRIIQGRPYESLKDLLRVKGIGEKTLEKIKDLITF